MYENIQSEKYKLHPDYVVFVFLAWGLTDGTKTLFTAILSCIFNFHTKRYIE